MMPEGRLASEFQVLLKKIAVVRVLDITGPQTPVITLAIDKLVRVVPNSRAQQQAIRARIVIVRTVPLNVCRTF